MANTTNFSVRMDSDVKKQCEALYGELGMNLTAAVNVFLRQFPDLTQTRTYSDLFGK